MKLVYRWRPSVGSPGGSKTAAVVLRLTKKHARAVSLRFAWTHLQRPMPCQRPLYGYQIG